MMGGTTRFWNEALCYPWVASVLLFGPQKWEALGDEADHVHPNSSSSSPFMYAKRWKFA